MLDVRERILSEGEGWTPYGVVRQTDRGYTGAWRDVVVGLTSLCARWYVLKLA